MSSHLSLQEVVKLVEAEIKLQNVEVVSLARSHSLYSSDDWKTYYVNLKIFNGDTSIKIMPLLEMKMVHDIYRFRDDEKNVYSFLLTNGKVSNIQKLLLSAQDY